MFRIHGIQKQGKYCTFMNVLLNTMFQYKERFPLSSLSKLPIYTEVCAFVCMKIIY